VRIQPKYVAHALLAGAIAAAMSVTPLAAADNSEFCTSLNTGATKCQKQGDVEVNDSLTRAATLPMWASIGQQSGGPYGGTFGGGSR
jgi:hypothetical protein